MSFLLAAMFAAGAPPTFEYLRTNSDGSEAERILVHSPEAGVVRVVKMRAPCTDAAYVTARLAPESGQARALVGGRLTHDLGQSPQAWLTQEEGRISARIGAPDAEIAFSTEVAERWLLYDFDFSEWAVNPPQEIAARDNFVLDLPLVWLGESGATLSNLGAVQFEYAGTGQAGGQDFVHYRARSLAFDGEMGELWFDAAQGHPLAIAMPIPNHAEYSDFLLRLVARHEEADAWRQLLAAHWAGCPDSR